MEIEGLENPLREMGKVADQGEVKRLVKACQRWQLFFLSKSNWCGTCMDKGEDRLQPQSTFGRAYVVRTRTCARELMPVRTLNQLPRRQRREGPRVLITGKCGGGRL